MNHFNRLIKIAIKKAKQNLNSQDFPIACILVLQDKKTNKIKHLTLAKNKVYTTGNCLMHAECLAIGEMCLKIKNSRFDDYFSTLYSTLEPCLMCYGAICHARIDRLVFGLKDGKFGFTSHVKSFYDGALQDKMNSNTSKSGYSHPEVFYGFCEEEIAKLLQNFTLNLR